MKKITNKELREFSRDLTFNIQYAIINKAEIDWEKLYKSNLDVRISAMIEEYLLTFVEVAG